jgi:hypothetical protein
MSEPWNEHPKLRGKFHPDFSDCLQVTTHRGGPRTSDRHPELVWVRVTGCENDVFSGVILKGTTDLRETSEGIEILFIVPDGAEQPLQVTCKYIQERPIWRILSACNKCGLKELFDPPSDLIALSFSGMPAAQLKIGFTFTNTCWCGGRQMVRLKPTAAPSNLKASSRVFLDDHTGSLAARPDSKNEAKVLLGRKRHAMTHWTVEESRV